MGPALEFLGWSLPWFPPWFPLWFPPWFLLKLCAVPRNLLCSLVRVKLSCYQREEQGSLSLEDYLKAFLETEVRPLWPKGWMQARWVLLGPAGRGWEQRRGC